MATRGSSGQTGYPGKKKATIDKREPIMDIGVKYEITIKESDQSWGRVQPQYTAYIAIDGIGYTTRKNYEKKVTGYTVEEVEQAAKRWVDQQREAKEPEPIKRIIY